MPRRTLIIGLAVLAGTGATIAFWRIDGPKPVAAQPAASAARKGDVVLSVGGLGKIVDLRAPTRVSAASAASAPSAFVVSRGVFPPATGRVLDVLVAAGQDVGRGQILARLDPTVASTSLVLAQASLDQAKAQLAADRSGVTPQSLAAARASVASAGVGHTGAKRNLVDTTRVEAAAIATATKQVHQSAAQLAADQQALGPAPQSLVTAQNQLAAAEQQLALDVRSGGTSSQSFVAARASVSALQTSLLSAQAALANSQAVDAQQVLTAEHVVATAGVQLGADQAKLERDRLTLRSVCSTTTPTITAETSSECVNAASTVVSDEQAILKDQGSIQSAQDTLAQVQANARQSESQARAQVDSTAAALAPARAQLLALQTAVTQAVAKDRQAVTAARQSLESLQLQNAQTVGRDRQALDLARLALTQARSRAVQNVSQARVQRMVAAVARANARAALSALRRGAPAALIRQDEAKITAAQAQLLAAQLAVGQTIVRSPDSGTLVSVLVAPGSPVDPSTAIVTIANLGQLGVNLDLSEFDAALVRKGMRAVVSVDALNGKGFPGTVLFEALSGIDNGGVVSFPVRIALGGPAPVKLGMNVSARIIVKERRNVVIVPLEAVSREGAARPSVAVVGPAGRLTNRRVVLGLADNKNVEIVRGVRVGERVVLRGGAGA